MALTLSKVSHFLLSKKRTNSCKLHKDPRIWLIFLRFCSFNEVQNAIRVKYEYYLSRNKAVFSLSPSTGHGILRVKLYFSPIHFSLYLGPRFYTNWFLKYVSRSLIKFIEPFPSKQRGCSSLTLVTDKRLLIARETLI